jgi:phosphomannomutase
VQISASHNPAEYNGLKLFSAQGRVVPGDVGQRVLERYNEGGGRRAEGGGRRAEGRGQRQSGTRGERTAKGITDTKCIKLLHRILGAGDGDSKLENR